MSFPTPKISSERTFVITGGNTGIGYETSKAIAEMGGRVVIACRSEERASQVSATIVCCYVSAVFAI